MNQLAQRYIVIDRMASPRIMLEPGAHLKCLLGRARPYPGAGRLKGLRGWVTNEAPSWAKATAGRPARNHWGARTPAIPQRRPATCSLPGGSSRTDGPGTRTAC